MPFALIKGLLRFVRADELFEEINNDRRWIDRGQFCKPIPPGITGGPQALGELGAPPVFKTDYCC